MISMTGKSFLSKRSWSIKLFIDAIALFIEREHLLQLGQRMEVEKMSAWKKYWGGQAVQKVVFFITLHPQIGKKLTRSHHFCLLFYKDIFSTSVTKLLVQQLFIVNQDLTKLKSLI